MEILIERTVSGAREYLVIEYAAGKNAVSPAIGCSCRWTPSINCPGTWAASSRRCPSSAVPGVENTKRKPRKAVREIAGELVRL